MSRLQTSEKNTENFKKCSSQFLTIKLYWKKFTKLQKYLYLYYNYKNIYLNAPN